jgi:Holliday junction resolvase RusA-like endonuclease
VIQQRPRLGKYGGFYDPSSKERKLLSMQLLAGRSGSGIHTAFDCELSVKFSFFYARHGRRKIDLSNMLKAVEDSGNGILWADDDQLIHVDAWKHGCEPSQERTELEIYAI